MKKEYKDGEALAEYRELCKGLDALITKGKGDTLEADDIRDMMEEPWYAMTEEEIKEIRNEAKQTNIR